MDEQNIQNHAEIQENAAPAPAPRRRRSDRYKTQEMTGEAAASVPAEAAGKASEPSDAAAQPRPVPTMEDIRSASHLPTQARHMEEHPGESGAMMARARRQMSVPPRQQGSVPRVPNPYRVGYAPGRMNEEDTRRTVLPRDQVDQEGLPARPGKPVVKTQRGRQPRETVEEPKRRMHPVLVAAVLVLVIIGLCLAGLMILPEDNGLRQQVTGLFRGVFGVRQETVANAAEEQKSEYVLKYSVQDEDQLVAPVDVLISATTVKEVQDLRLVNERGEVIAAECIPADNTEETPWLVTLRVENGYQGTVSLQVYLEDRWQDAGCKTKLKVASSPAQEGEKPRIPEEGEGFLPTASPTPEPTPVPTEEPVEEPEEDEPVEEEPTEEPTAVPTEEPTEEPTPEVTPEPEPISTPEPTPEATDAPTPEPTATPVPEMEAAFSADPALITTSNVYSGKKRVSEYSRAAKELIHMPVGGEYTRNVKMGVLTFRTDAFRQNAAIGTVPGASALEEVWKVQAASVRGSNGQMYYGIGRNGQPAIVMWSKEVREKSNMFESKLDKKQLKEVIIAGLDGNIYFLDLEDGSNTRNIIKLGYPMKGTPSVHPGGFPYMNVGQFARKMKTKTGKIGLRQYNLYNQKELTLIDGLDGKLHRPLNDVGSFETSALIDRSSDTMVTAGSNGMLYVTSLNSNFDYVEGIYKQSPSTVVLRTKAKSERKNTQTAVEASVAMYDRFVYYADMGGVLRCVDTNTLRTVWAVETGDAVESTPALDREDGDGLSLYTANLLSSRSTGAAQIRRYDALTGLETWTMEVPVKKNSKTKQPVGVFASPVVGQGSLSQYVYFTVTGLSADGREMLGLAGEEAAALIALNKQDGTIAWAYGLAKSCESSPVAVYDEGDNGWIIQCGSDGVIALLNGETGEEMTTLTVEGAIEASPAVYGDMMVIGTTGKGTSYIYGIRIY